MRTKKKGEDEMKKRFLSVLLVLCLLVGLMPTAAFAAGSNLPFTDVGMQDWFYDAVQYTYEKKLMTGTGETTFTPGGTTSRGMIVTILHRLEGKPAADGADFADVAGGAYYADAVAWASANGIVNGYGEGTFGPDDAITREQAAAILYRYVQYRNMDVSRKGELSGFADAGQVSSFAEEAMGWAFGAKLITGVSDTELSPQGSTTRAQMATILMRLCEEVLGGVTVNENGVPEIDSPGNTGGDTTGGETTGNTGGTGGGNTGSTGGTTGGGSTGGTTGGGSTPPVVYYYTVTFDVLAGDAANVPEAQQVRSGERAARPVYNPTRAGYAFDGWYSDDACTTRYNFGAAVTGNLTLYAKWTPETPATGETHRVVFDLNDADLHNGRSTIYEVQNVPDCGRATRPATDPERELYAFKGWYAEPSCGVVFDFDEDIVTGDLTLYAGWGSPDPDDEGVFAATNTEETVYSISGLAVDERAATATVNVNSMSILQVDFYEDTLGENWTKDAVTELVKGTPAASVAVYTPDYGELIPVRIPLEAVTLPAHYFAVARLISSEGKELASFLYIEGSKRYENFEELTVDSFGDDELVLNFDESRNTNFGVLNPDTKVIESSDTANVLTVADIDVEDRLVPDHTYTFANPDASVQALAAGDVVYVKGTQWLFMVKEAIQNDDGSITFTPDKEAGLSDFYTTLKVDMGAAGAGADAGIQTMSIEDVHVEDSFSYSSTPPGIDIETEDKKFHGSLRFSASEEFTLKVIYDVKIFAKDYLEVSLTTKTTTGASFSLTGDFTPGKVDKNSELNNEDLLGRKGKVAVPTPIPGLEVYTKVALPISLRFTASVKVDNKTVTKSGFSFNTYNGRNDIKETEKSLSVKVEGAAKLKVGPKVSAGLQLTGGVLSAEINGSAGAEISATVSIGSDDVTNNVPSKHACLVCVAGEAKWFAEVHISADYDIKVIHGNIVDIKLIGIEKPIQFPGTRIGDGKFYVTVVPGYDSVFTKRNTEDKDLFFGFGTCPNVSYRTEFKTVDANEAELTGISVHVRKNINSYEKTGNSTYVVYLHDGIYTVDATIGGNKVQQTVVVKGAAQTVVLSPSSSDKQLAGMIVDSNTGAAIEGAEVVITSGGMTLAKENSDSSGSFKATVPAGRCLVTVTKDDYITYTIYQTVDDDQPTTQMETIRLIPGSGMGGFHGRITDATTNQPIGNVKLDLRKGWGNTSEGDILETLYTDSEGKFSYGTVEVFGAVVTGLKCGNYTLAASRDGYSETSFNIVVLPGKIESNPAQDFVMAPRGGDTWRIVLTWGADPRDLDSHVVGTLSGGSSFHVYYGHKSQYDGALEVCNLDLDDTTGYGPETITLKADAATPYYYYIHRYAGSGTISASGAQIKVYHGSDPARTFNVPTGAGSGIYWNVFAIVNGQLVVQNTIGSSPITSYAGTGSGVSTLAVEELIDKKDVPPTDPEVIGAESEDPELEAFRAEAMEAVAEYGAEELAALTGQAAEDAAAARSAAEAAIEEAEDQAGILDAFIAYQSAVEAILIGAMESAANGGSNQAADLPENGSDSMETGNPPEELPKETVTDNT